jgi:hypothetical protein
VQLVVVEEVVDLDSDFTNIILDIKHLWNFILLKYAWYNLKQLSNQYKGITKN